MTYSNQSYTFLPAFYTEERISQIGEYHEIIVNQYKQEFQKQKAQKRIEELSQIYWNGFEKKLDRNEIFSLTKPSSGNSYQLINDMNKIKENILLMVSKYCFYDVNIGFNILFSANKYEREASEFYDKLYGKSNVSFVFTLKKEEEEWIILFHILDQFPDDEYTFKNEVISVNGYFQLFKYVNGNHILHKWKRIDNQTFDLDFSDPENFMAKIIDGFEIQKVQLGYPSKLSRDNKYVKPVLENECGQIDSEGFIPQFKVRGTNVNVSFTLFMVVEWNKQVLSYDENPF